MPPWQVFAAFTVLVMVGYMTVLVPYRGVVYPVFTLITVALLGVGIVKQRPTNRLAFWVLFAGALTNSLGDVAYFGYFGRFVGHPVPYPSAADAFYFVSYLLYLAGLVVLAHDELRSRGAAEWIDTSIVVAAIGLVMFVYVIHPTLVAPHVSLIARVVAILAPSCDVLIVGVLVLLVSSRNTSSHLALLLGFFVFLTADMIYSVLASHGSYVGGVLDLGWISARALIAIAVLLPSVAVSGSLSGSRLRLSKKRFALLACLALVGLVVHFQVEQGHARSPVLWGSLAGSALLFVLVIARLADLNRSLSSSMDELETEHVARRALARRTLWTSERERNRIASELHDGPVQQLTALSYRIEALRARMTSDGRPDPGFLEVQEQLATELAGLRQLMATLRPGSLVERGLEAPIADYCAKSLKGSQIVPRLYFDLPTRPDQEIETIMYRVVQDAIAKAVRSPYTSTLDVSLSQKDDLVQLTVADNGDGQEPDMSDVVWLGMKERIEMTGGTFLVSSTRGAGTTVEARVPMRGTP